MSYIVVSFLNVTAGAPPLALIDIATSEVRALRVPGWRRELNGIAGLALSERYLYAVTPGSAPDERGSGERGGPSCLLIFDRDGLALRSEYTCSSVFAAHSILAADGGLYAVSTGTDELVWIELDGPVVVAERVVWRPDPTGPREDIHHLNTISRYRGDLLVAGFGERAGLHWTSATDGFIVNLRTDERLASGLRHPHSLLGVDGDIALCESSVGTVRVLGGTRSRRLVGYPRGLCRVGDTLFVGVSRGRQISRSTGALANRTEPDALTVGEDSVTLVGRCSVARLSLYGFDVEGVGDFYDYGWEIYDLLAIEDAPGWPVGLEVGWRGEAIRGLRESVDRREVTIARFATELAERDHEIARLHRAVAKRDQVLTPLGVLALNRLLRRLRAASGRLRSTRPIQSMLARLAMLAFRRLRRGIRRTVVGRDEGGQCGC